MAMYTSQATRRRLSGPRKRTTLSLPAALVEEAVRELGYPNLTAAVVATLDDALRARKIEEFAHSELGPTPEALDELRRGRGGDVDEPHASLG
jgi:Arc/MetJ family transcription regulator